MRETKIEPTFLCFTVAADALDVECAAFVSSAGIPLTLAVNQVKRDGIVGDRNFAIEALDRAAGFVNRLLEQEIPWSALVSCCKSAKRPYTPIVALIAGAQEAILLATHPLRMAAPLPDHGRDFDREC